MYYMEDKRRYSHFIVNFVVRFNYYRPSLFSNKRKHFRHSNELISNAECRK